MATNQPSASGTTQEYTVRLPKNTTKKHMVLKFNPANNVDFTKCGSAKIERENNVREYKLSHDVDTMPKFGAGSEFGREQKEEARRKKYGIMIKRYNPDDQPWLMKLGNGKQARKFKGLKEGGVLDNASYYIFTQCPDGAFEAHPVKEWYNFTPVIKYKYLNADEAEEEYSKRDKTMNYFSIMLKKRLKPEGQGDDDDEEGEKTAKKTKKKGKSADFMLTEMQDWSDSSEGEADSEQEGGDDDDDKPKKKKKKVPGRDKARKTGQKTNSDSEALEDSDDMDEGQEVDYITDSDSDDEEMYSEDVREKTDKYTHKGVEDEDDLRKMISSGEEDEEEEKKDKEEPMNEDDQSKDGLKEKGKKASESDSSSSSGSDSDPENESNFTSALFMQGKEKKPKKTNKVGKNRRGSGSSEASAQNSRSTTPTEDGSKAKKRKKGHVDSPLAKKSRSETPDPKKSPTPPPSSSASFSPVVQGASEGITEDSVRRYLMRKPMTTKDLMMKFRSKNTGLSKDQLVNSIVQILKRLNPEKNKVKDKLYLFIKKTD